MTFNWNIKAAFAAFIHTPMIVVGVVLPKYVVTVVIFVVVLHLAPTDAINIESCGNESAGKYWASKRVCTCVYVCICVFFMFFMVFAFTVHNRSFKLQS